MGDRVNVVIRTGSGRGIALYGHWAGHRTADTVARFLAKNPRLDSDYFARAFFCHFIADSVDGPNGKGFASGADPAWLLTTFADSTGFGIGSFLAGDREHPVIVLNPSMSTVSIETDRAIITADECVTRAGMLGLGFGQVAALCDNGRKFVEWSRLMAAWDTYLREATNAY